MLPGNQQITADCRGRENLSQTQIWTSRTQRHSHYATVALLLTWQSYLEKPHFFFKTGLQHISVDWVFFPPCRVQTIPLLWHICTVAGLYRLTVKPLSSQNLYSIYYRFHNAYLIKHKTAKGSLCRTKVTQELRNNSATLFRDHWYTLFNQLITHLFLPTCIQKMGMLTFSLSVHCIVFAISLTHNVHIIVFIVLERVTSIHRPITW